MIDAGAWCEEMQRRFPVLYRRGLAHEFGAGWRPLIERLSAKLEPICAGCDDDKYFGRPYAAQVKEKYGGLRFYMSHSTELTDKKIEALIDSAEDEAEMTCEECGGAGRLRNGGWVRTLCDDCFNEMVPNRQCTYVQ